MERLKIGVDNYCLFPLALSPFEVLEWARAAGAEGVQFSGLDAKNASIIDKPYLEDLKQAAAAHGLYLEWGGARHIPREMTSWGRKEIFENNKRAAAEAAHLGARVVRSCSGGLMRWDDGAPATEALLRETAGALRGQTAMLRDHGVVLAVETHFEFTTHEILRIFEMCEAEPGDCLGICLDTMNLLTMLEDPPRATERVLPWVVATHVKDGGLAPAPDGLMSFPAEIGRGVIDLRRIARLLGTLSWEVNLSIEDHGGSFSLPVFDSAFLSRFPDLTAQEFASLLRLERETEEKMRAGDCALTAREDWPGLCEERTRRDIGNLKSLLRGNDGAAAR